MPVAELDISYFQNEQLTMNLDDAILPRWWTVCSMTLLIWQRMWTTYPLHQCGHRMAVWGAVYTSHRAALLLAAREQRCNWYEGTRSITGAASIMRSLSRGRPRDNSAVHGASEDVPGMTYDVPGVSYPIPWTSGDCPQGVRPADGPGTHSLASTGPFSQAAVHRTSGLLRFSQSQRGRIMDRKWGCPQYVRNRKLMSRSCPGNATATLQAALTFFVKNKLILL